MTTQILHGDCRDVLKTLPDGSVNCCVTSPPYFGLRDYGHDGQIGLEQTPEAYVAELVAVFRDVKRVLRDDGVVFLNLGDSYFGGGGHSPNSPSSATSKSGKYGKNGVLIKGHTAGGQRAKPCDTSGKEPEDSTGHGCLCGSLCDACRKAYQIGKSHSDSLHVPTQAPSPSATIREHTESPIDHLPTSGSCSPANHSGAANSDPASFEALASEPLPVSPQTMTGESSPQHPEGFRQSHTPLDCLLCGQTLERDALATEDRMACTCGTGSPSGASTRRTLDKSVSYLAYPHLTINGGACQGLKPKDLIGIPWRVAFALQADGWYLRQDIIWHKPNPMPESVTDRCTKAHEYIFLLTKSARYFYDAEAVKEDATDCKPRPPKANHWEGQDKHDTKAGFCKGTPAYFTRNRRSVWTVTTQPYSEAHFATFPPDLIRPCILAGCPSKVCAVCGAPWERITESTKTFESGSGKSGKPINGKQDLSASSTNSTPDIRKGPVVHTKTIGWMPTCKCNGATQSGTVIDPFGGSGTTGEVAEAEGRNSILIELNESYVDLIHKRTAQQGLFCI